MYEYTGNVKDPQRSNEIEKTDEEVTEAVKKMLDEPIAQCSKTGLAPFYASNKPPAIRNLSFLPLLIRLHFNIILTNPCLVLQAKDSF